MKNVYQQMEESGAREIVSAMKQKQALPYELKIRSARQRVREYYHEICNVRGANVHVSVGGLDSITLFVFIRDYCHLDVPGVSASILEDKSIQAVHGALGIETVDPIKSKYEVIQEFGYPIISKEIAAKIENLQNPTEKNKTIRHAIITGETGEYGGWQKNSRMKLPKKWLELFGGYENENEGTNYKTPDFLVSAKCCYYLKEKPCDDWAKSHNSFPYLGLMASEGGRREKALMLHGCNYYGKTTTRSCPFAPFSRQDLLRLALELNVPIPEIYGSIERNSKGEYYTTKAQRTGCSMCGFGIHMEKRPHRFDLLRKKNYKEWHFWMYDMGWGHVLDYIGVKWEDEVQEYEQMCLPGFIDYVWNNGSNGGNSAEISQTQEENEL